MEERLHTSRFPCPPTTGIHIEGIHIDADLTVLEPGHQKLGLFSNGVQPELRSKIVDIQLTAAEANGLGSRSYELIDITKEKKEDNS